MKIGIVTWFKGGNYGTNLQAIALYSYLCKKGHHCELINYFSSNKLLSRNILTKYLYYFKLFSKKYFPILSIIKNAFSEKSIIKAINIQKSYKDINIVNIFNSKDFENLKSFDIYITGSDQIWNPYYLDTFYMLDFITKVKKISYSSSIGVSDIPKSQTIVYKNNLSSFSHISVREKSGELLLRNLLSRDDIKTVLDPVFLLSKQQWIEFSSNTNINIPKGKYLLCYMVGNRIEYHEYIKNIIKSNSFDRLIYITSTENPNIDFEGIKCTNAGPMEFIKYLQQADTICTDSFHATAFSLIFKKNFFEFMRFSDEDSQSQNSRIIDLLTHYDLQNRIIRNVYIPLGSIDYRKVDAILNEDIRLSKKYLENSILT